MKTNIKDTSSMKQKRDKKSQVLVKISVKSKDLDLNLKTNEEYTLTVNTRVHEEKPRDEILVVINSATFYGARHALGTYLRYLMIKFLWSQKFNF